MDFVAAIVVSAFDLVFIVGELTVDGVGYVAWIVYALVFLLHPYFLGRSLTWCSLVWFSMRLSEWSRWKVLSKSTPHILFHIFRYWNFFERLDWEIRIWKWRLLGDISDNSAICPVVLNMFTRYLRRLFINSLNYSVMIVDHEFRTTTLSFRCQSLLCYHRIFNSRHSRWLNGSAVTTLHERFDRSPSDTGAESHVCTRRWSTKFVMLLSRSI